MQIPAALRAAGIAVEVHDVIYGKPTPENPAPEDAVWLSLCAERRWVALTKDDKIRYDELSKQVLLSGRVPVFALTAQDMPGPAMCAAYVGALPRILRVLLADTPIGGEWSP